MIRRTPISTRTDPLFPYTTLFRSTGHAAKQLGKNVSSRRAAGRVRMRTTDQIRSVRARGRAVHASELSGVAQCGHHLGSEGAHRRFGILDAQAGEPEATREVDVTHETATVEQQLHHLPGRAPRLPPPAPLPHLLPPH